MLQLGEQLVAAHPLNLSQTLLQELSQRFAFFDYWHQIRLGLHLTESFFLYVGVLSQLLDMFLLLALLLVLDLYSLSEEFILCAFQLGQQLHLPVLIILNDYLTLLMFFADPVIVCLSIV